MLNIMHIRDKIINRYLTWKTGKDESTRAWEEWVDITIKRRASTIENMLDHFDYIIEVKWDKVMNPYASHFGLVLVQDLRQYMYPARDLNNCAVFLTERVSRNKFTGERQITCLGDEDIAVIATNNKVDAMIIALKYS